MADFTNTKAFGTKIYPVEAESASNLLRRCEAILSPELLKSRYLTGIEDVNSKYSPDELKQEIELAINEFELISELSVTKVSHSERLPFDRQAYKAFVFMKTNNGPILSIERLQIQSSNGENIYDLPPDWIETGLMHKRQVNLIPILSIFGASGLQDGQPSNAGLIFIQAVNNFAWLPAFYTIEYTTGISHTEGQVPIVVNDIIGMTAAILILSALQANITQTSTSIGQDGISQSSSGPGPRTYEKRIEDLTERRDKMLRKIKAIFHQKYYMSNI